MSTQRAEEAFAALTKSEKPIFRLVEEARTQGWTAADVRAFLARIEASGRLSQVALDGMAQELFKAVEAGVPFDTGVPTRRGTDAEVHSVQTAAEQAQPTRNPPGEGDATAVVKRTETSQATGVATDGVVTAISAVSHPSHARQTLPPEAIRSAPARKVEIGAVLKDRFVLESMIAKGGMGIVYKARDRRREEAMDRHPHIAIKVLGDEFRRHPDAFMALQREAKKAQELAHPNVVTVYDFDRDGPIVYMTMELLTGEALSQIIKRVEDSGMPVKQALPLIRGMAEGLAYAHNKHIVHSDVKPGNVFVTEQQVVKVLDFGIARAAVRPGQNSDETEFDAGSLGALTPTYASCEMFAKLEPDPRDDIYALACMAYELLAGKHPFKRMPAPQARAQKLKPDPIPTLTRRQWQGLLKGLAFEREDRTASAMELLAALEDRPAKRSRAILAGATAATVSAIIVFFVTPAIRPDKPEPLPEPEPMSAQVAGQVSRLLDVAEAHRMVGRLIEPPGSSAFDAYQQVLEIHPYDRDALQGLAEIADHFLQQAKQAEADQNEQRALLFAALARKADPRNRAIARFYERLARRNPAAAQAVSLTD